MSEFFNDLLGKPFLRYAIAVGVIGASFLVRVALVQDLGLALPPFILLYPAVMLVAILSGLGPGLLATALAVLITDYSVMQPVGHFAISSPSDAIALAFFAGMGLLMSMVAERYRQTQMTIAAIQVELAQQKSEQELQHAFEFSRLALDAAGLGTWEFLPESDEVSADENCLRLFGFRPEEEYAKADLQARIHPDDRGVVSDTISRSIAGSDGGLWGMEYRVVWPDGSIHWLTSHGRCYFTGEGERRRAVRLIGVNMDITGPKTADESRMAERAKLDVALASMTDAVFISDASGKPIQFNDAFSTFHRFASNVDAGTGLDDVRECVELFTIEGEFVPLEKRAIARALRGETRTNVEYKLRRKDTGHCWFGSYSFSPLRDNLGAIIGSVVVARDITESKQAEQVLRKSERQYSALFANKTNAIAHCKVITDANGQPVDYVILNINEAYERIIGMKEAKVAGRRVKEIFPGIEHHSFDYIGVFGKVGLEGSESTFEAFFKPTGQTLSVYAYSPSPGEFTAIFTDITERKRAEDELRKSEILYRGLFSSMDEGFCVIELIYDPQGKPVDYVFLEVNAAFERHTGMRDPVGKRMREFAPALESYWPEFFGRVALTGESAHFTNEAKDLSRCFEIRAYCVGEPQERHVAVVFEEITERLQAERALRQQAELLDLAHDTIMVLDLDGTIRFWNAGAKEMYGFSSAEAKGRNAHELLSTSFPRPLKEIEEIILNEGRWDGELTHIGRDGAHLVVASRWALQRDLDGKPSGVLQINNDISERKRAEEHTRKLYRAYTVLSDINQTIVREKDSAAMLAAACRIAVEKGNFRLAWIGMVEATTQQLRTVAFSGKVDGYLEQLKIDLLNPDSAGGPAARCFFSGKHATCSDIEHELFRPWRSEALRNGYKSIAAFPLKSEGRVIGIFCLYASELAFFDDDEIRVLDEMAMDISYALDVNRHEKERQKADEELRWRTAFFEAMVDSSGDGIMVVNGKGERPIRNRRLVELFKIPAEIVELGDDSQQRKFVESMMKNPARYLEKFDYLNSHPDEMSWDEVELTNGTILERQSSPVIDRAKKHYGRIWTFRDITERRQLEEQFRQAQKMEAIGQLTGGISHDFNNMLTVILGCAEMMADEVKEYPRLSKMLEMITGAAQRGADLTHRLLAFARRQSLQPRPVNINLLLTGMEGFLRRTLTAEIALKVTPSARDYEAIVDPTQLESAVLNLCLNARDAMPDGGRLTIDTSYVTLDSDYVLENSEVSAGDYILIAVSDTGTGISPENLRRVFDPFFTTKEVGKGTGLGLSMVYGFVKQSKGHVKVYSEPGLGTSVKLYLPKATHHIEPAKPQRAPFADFRGSETVLLVEDNDPVREVAKAQLINLGYHVLEAANGNDAMELVRANANIDLLFTDMAMPGGMNGRDLANKACGLRSKLKVLISSGYADNATFDEGFPGGKVAVLNKPYTRLELATKVREVLMEG
jgi:PAS domain S-box-containing protein